MMSARTAAALLSGLVAYGCVSPPEVPPGVAPRLAADEGFAVLSLFSEKHDVLGYLYSEDSLRFRYRLPSAAGTTTVRVVRLPAGRYHWSKLVINGTNLAIDVEDYREHDGSEFVVEAGKITCARTLILADEALFWRTGRTWMWRPPSLSFVNQATKVLRVLGRDHATLIAAQPLTLGSEYPDPFLDFWTREKASPAAAAP